MLVDETDPKVVNSLDGSTPMCIIPPLVSVTTSSPPRASVFSVTMLFEPEKPPNGMKKNPKKIEEMFLLL